MLNRVKDDLYMEGVPLREIAETYGTPCFVYSEKAISSAYQAFDNAFSEHPHRICYSVKANSNLALLQTLVRLGAGFDIVSGGELARVLKAGGDPSSECKEVREGILSRLIIFGDQLFANVAGPSKDEDTLYQIIAGVGESSSRRSTWRDGGF